jgi:hypothetical protein
VTQNLLLEVYHDLSISGINSHRVSRTSSPVGSLLLSAGESDPADDAHPDKYGSVVLFVPGSGSQPVYTFYGNFHTDHLEDAQADSA